MKKFLSLLLIIPLFVYCQPTPPANNEGNEENQENVNPGTDPEDPDYAKAAPGVKNGDKVLATNRNVEKFLTEVTYQDKDWSTTRIYEFYGGFNGVKYNENGEPDENGKYMSKPVSDKPESYSIRWKKDLEAGSITVHLEDNAGWSNDYSVTAGKAYCDITNLLPNAHYKYSATGENGKVMAQGEFDTYGHLHQCYFKSDVRNCRDLGGWITESGKMVRYRRLYRTGRWDAANLSKAGRAEIIAEGFGGQLDLRGTSDVLSGTTVNGLDFCAPSFEQGGKAMLGVTNEVEAEKFKRCFEFSLDQVRKGKGVAFHCSLGRDRTGTLAVVFLGLLGVPEHDISKEYEVSYFAPLGYSVSSSETASAYDKDKDCWIFQNNRTKWVYSEIAPYFWQLAGNGSFADGVEKYLLDVAKVPQAEIDEFRQLMLVDAPAAN